MLSSLPQIHAAALVLASIGAIAGGAIILARHARTRAARLHFVYACALAWWWISMASIATAESVAEVDFWARILHLSIGMLPGVIFHLNVSLAGLEDRFRTRVLGHWIASVVITVFAVSWPGMFLEPSSFAWGFYPRYSLWGLLVVGHGVVVIPAIVHVFRSGLELDDPRTARYQKGRTYVVANAFALLATADYVAAFGVPVYPVGYLIVMGVMGLVLRGSFRDRLVEFTPEYAAEYVLEEMPDGLLVVDTRGFVQVANRSAAELLGRPVDQAQGVRVDALGGPSALLDLLRDPDVEPSVRELSFQTESGRERHLKLAISRIEDQHDFPIATLFMTHDISETKRAQKERDQLEESVRAAQKLESLGVMAGGIAHDFNNLLLAILGNAEMASAKSADTPDVARHLEMIESAAERAAELTGQMLTYTGNRPVSRRPLDLNELIQGLSGLMDAGISKKAELHMDLDPGLPCVLGDSGQMTQVIMNLVTNAAEALDGDAGQVTLRTRVAPLDATFESLPGETASASDEPYVLLELEDSGVGMDEDTRDRIFDPFFSTKFTGRGLGLATVIGIVRSHQGRTRVRTAPGEGTTFTIAFPPTDNAAASAGARPDPVARRPHETTVLVADDEPLVLKVARSILADVGFSVITATDGREAVARFRAHADAIDVVVLDRTMPHMGGEEVFATLRETVPDLPVVFMSGYTDALAESLGPHAVLLAKPFRSADLIEKIQEVLEG